MEPKDPVDRNALLQAARQRESRPPPKPKKTRQHRAHERAREPDTELLRRNREIVSAIANGATQASQGRKHGITRMQVSNIWRAHGGQPLPKGRPAGYGLQVDVDREAYEALAQAHGNRAKAGRALGCTANTVKQRAMRHCAREQLPMPVGPLERDTGIDRTGIVWCMRLLGIPSGQILAVMGRPDTKKDRQWLADACVKGKKRLYAALKRRGLEAVAPVPPEPPKT